MEASGIFGFVQILSMFFFGGGAGFPLGIPPAAEDPAMANVAPADCTFYMTWSGVAAPDPQSRNQTEQLLAEKEVQQSLKQLDLQIVAGLRAATAGDPQAAACVDDIHLVAKTVLTSPTAIFVSKIETDDRGPAAVRGGAYVNLGDQAAAVAEALSRIEANLHSEDVSKPAGDSPWHRLRLGEGGPAQHRQFIEWAVKGRYLVVGLGEGEAAKIVARAGQQPPDWLRQLREQLAVPRPASLIYGNVSNFLKLAGPETREMSEMLNVLGLAQVKAVASATGLDDTGCITRTQVSIDGEPKGLLSVFLAEPLTKEHLAPLPKDAVFALAARFDVAKLYKDLLKTAGQIDPRTQQGMLSEVQRMEATLKVKLYDDILHSLGDIWRVYASPSEGNLVFTGLTAVVDIRDHQRLVAANSKLVFGSLFGGMAKGLSEPRGSQPGPIIAQTKCGDQTIFYMTRMGSFTPLSPAWCITDKEFVVALFPQNVKAYLERAGHSGGPSLADLPAVSGPFEANRPMAVSYLDTTAAFRLIYPIAELLLAAGSNESGRGGPSLDMTILPPAPVIGRHLQPAVTTVARNKQGIFVETHQTLPIGGMGGLTLLPAMWFFAAAESPRMHALPTPQNASKLNLQQIGLGLHNYHSVYGGFPPAAAGHKQGQPPVSWRVLILPYLEEDALYRQYHFDEPWDSASNKKLLLAMPKVFQAPGSRKSAQGMTNYLAVAGKPYALSSEHATSLAEFIDGTSNTILVVEASDERAVPWTKPEDYSPDESKPSAGLVGLRDGRFLALAADASVHVIPAHIDAKILNALYTRAGREPVNFPESP